MFGLSFGELVLLVIIALVVIGPRDLPRMMRQLGRTVAKLKRMTSELREQSGIDEILRAEGIEREVQELRKLATGRILDVDLYEGPRYEDLPPRSREYPTGGVDSYGAIAEDVAPYVPGAPLLPAADEEGRVSRGSRRGGLPGEPPSDEPPKEDEPAKPADPAKTAEKADEKIG